VSFLLAPRGSRLSPSPVQEVTTIEETDEAVELVERVCALDIGKATLTACIRVPNETKPGHRGQEVREYATTWSLLELTDRLRADGVVVVAMEPPELLEAGVLPAGSRGFTCWLAQRHPRQERPRPAQDRPAGRGVAGEGGQARQVPAELRAATTDPPVA
jgi:hypothetical protein